MINKANAKPSKFRSLKLQEQRLSTLLVMPAVLIVGGIYLYPSILTIIYSFSTVDVRGMTVSDFVGLANYIDLLGSHEFWVLTARTLYFGTVIIILSVIISFAIAILLDQDFKGRTMLRVLILLPWAVPPVVSAVMWGQVFHSEAGTLNAIIYQLGLGSGDTLWLGSPLLALHVIIFAEVWRAVPFITLFLLAGLQNIPDTLFDAASIDGANVWQKFRYILLPLIMPVLLPLIVVRFAWAMKSFDIIFVLTRGGQRTRIINYFVYQEGFEFLNFGTATAAAFLLLILTLIVVGILVLIQKRYIAGGFGE